MGELSKRWTYLCSPCCTKRLLIFPSQVSVALWIAKPHRHKRCQHKQPRPRRTCLFAKNSAKVLNMFKNVFNRQSITILCTFAEQNAHLQNMLNLISQCICYACLVYHATKDQLPSHPTLIALRAWSIADLSGLTRRLKLQNIEKVR